MLLTIYAAADSAYGKELASPNSTVPRLRSPDLNQSQNIFVKMELLRYLLQLRSYSFLWGSQNFESFKISNETEVPKLKKTFKSPRVLSYCLFIFY